MKPLVLIHFLALSLVACGRGQPCPTCDDDGADDDQPADMAEDLPDLPCGGADLQNDDLNCGTCGNRCWTTGSSAYEAGGCVAGTCSPIWHGQEWPEPTPLTCDDVCGTLSCHANACAGLTGFVCESILGESCEALGNGAGNLLLDLSGPCDEWIPWPEVILGGDRLVFCCCG
jgi:hypothetical protein